MTERLLVISILLVVVGISAGITWSKGQRAAFVLGFLILGMIWIVAACRLAYPSSWWARHFYGPKKMSQAVEWNSQSLNGIVSGGLRRVLTCCAGCLGMRSMPASSGFCSSGLQA